MADTTMRSGFMAALTQSSSAMLGAAVVGILFVLVIPLPTIILDLLLAFNITLSVVILMMSMYVLRPLEFSAFPSVLLGSTLLRLSLNVASARLILLHGKEGTGAAGKVIQAFGSFVVGGNYAVGIVIFCVLVLINLIVITKGATRIAEVAARFTLDAMPGKQMAIDADLNTGLINESEARRRRKEIADEANFYGAMDGASKFISGEAMAGVVVLLINIIGGLIVGVLQQGMDVATAARTYTILTVGDGLVTQVPAIVVSTSVGMLVTRTAAETDLGEDVKKQLFSQPRAIGMASAIIFFFALIPGMPKFAFIVIASLFGFLAYQLFTASARREALAIEEVPPEPAEMEEVIAPPDLMGLEVGYGLIPLVDSSQGGELLQRIKAMRRQLALEMGFVMPAIHIRDNLRLKPSEYAISIKGIEIAKGELMLGHHLAITVDEKGPKPAGIETREPAFGIPAVWVPDREREIVQARGFVVVDPATVVTTHLTELVKAHADELLGRQEVQTLLDNLAASYPKVVNELVPKVVSVGILQKVLQRLLKERLSIRNLLAIIEILADYVTMTKNVDLLTGYVRQSLARAITKQYQDGEGNISVVMVSPNIEDMISHSIQHTEYESFVSPDPGMVKRLIASLQNFIGTFTAKGLQPIVLCSPNTRIHLRKILERFFPNIIVISHNEITHDANIKSLGMVEL